MLAKLIQRITLIFTLVAAFAFFLLILMVGNPHAFWQVAGEIHDDVFAALSALGTGITIVFFVVVILGTATWILKLRQESGLIRPGKYGPVQAVRQGKTIIELSSPHEVKNMDPLQQIAYAQKLLQLAAVANAKIQRVAEEEPKQIAAPEAIPPVIRYEDVADEVPDEMSLLGIHPSDGTLELTDWEKLKMVWLVGSSSTGKSNTIFGKALEARNKGAKLAVVDQHITKPDSLGKKLAPLQECFLRPIAVKDDEVLATLAWFKAEFERRVNGADCSQKIVLICDEMNRMVRNDALKDALKEIVMICGEESRGFGMYGWFLSQKCAGLKWLRDSAITVIVHRLTRFEEAKLACNEDTAAARKLLTFKVGRTYIYGVDFDEPVELQQPLYEAQPKEEHPSTFDEQVIESNAQSEVQSTLQINTSISDRVRDMVQEPAEPMDHVFPFDERKLRLVREKILQRCNQNDIICEVWQVKENTRAFREAKVEFQETLAYLASLAGGE